MWLTFFTFLMTYLFAVECVDRQSSVQAFVGTNALLPCDCPAKKSLSWQDVNNLVITSISEDGYEANHHRFINRTQLFKHQEENNCSLLILGVKVEDQGNYTCHSIGSSLRSETVELKVIGTSKQIDEPNGSSWAIGVAVISTLVVALGVLVVYLSYRRKCAQVMNDHVESKIESDETEDSPLKRVQGISAECRAHQCKTHMTTES